LGIEIIGAFSHRRTTDAHPAPLSDFDLDFLRGLVERYDRAGFDRMLIANGARWPDSLPFAAYIAAITSRVGFMIAHRPGFVAPTMAARMLAVIDRLSQGRAAVHIITGANDLEMQGDGDFLTKDVRYERSAEYVEILRRMWSSAEPFDYEGEFYRFRQAFAELKPAAGRMPVFWGGASDAAIDAGARCADVFAMGIDSLEQTGKLIERVKSRAADYGRSLDFCVGTRVILGDTEEEAWRTADGILQGVKQVSETVIRNSMKYLNRAGKAAVDAKLEKALSQGPVLDERLWIEITRATLGARAATSLVGTADQVVAAMEKYYDLGVRRFLIEGFDFDNDAETYGRDLIPRLRAMAAGREGQTAPT
jgi:alkanesulfonate monooxygenase